MYHFVPIAEFKLELQSGNAQFGSNSMIFRAVRPWNVTDDLEKTIQHLFYATSSFMQHFVPIGEFKLELQSGNAQSGSNSMILEPCDLEIWRMTLNKANLRDFIAATGLVISNWIQIVNFSARVTVKFDGWPCKTIGHLFYATSSFVHLFVPIGEFKLKLQSGNSQSGSNWMIFRAVWPWNLTDDLAKQ